MPTPTRHVPGHIAETPEHQLLRTIPMSAEAFDTLEDALRERHNLQSERDALLALVRRLLLNPDLPIEGTLKYHDARALLQSIDKGAK